MVGLFGCKTENLLFQSCQYGKIDNTYGIQVRPNQIHFQKLFEAEDCNKLQLLVKLQ